MPENASAQSAPAKHTTGQWIVEPVFIAQQSGGALHFGEYRFPFQRLEDGSSRTYPRDEAIANACLIAAAPDLLAALKYLRNYARMIDVSDATMARVDRAIQAAEGGTQ